MLALRPRRSGGSAKRSTSTALAMLMHKQDLWRFQLERTDASQTYHATI